MKKQKKVVIAPHIEIAANLLIYVDGKLVRGPNEEPDTWAMIAPYHTTRYEINSMLDDISNVLKNIMIEEGKKIINEYKKKRKTLQ